MKRGFKFNLSDDQVDELIISSKKKKDGECKGLFTVLTPGNKEGSLRLFYTNKKQGWVKIEIDLSRCEWDLNDLAKNSFYDYVKVVNSEKIYRNSKCGNDHIYVEVKRGHERDAFKMILEFLGNGDYLSKLQIL